MHIVWVFWVYFCQSDYFNVMYRHVKEKEIHFCSNQHHTTTAVARHLYRTRNIP